MIKRNNYLLEISLIQQCGSFMGAPCPSKCPNKKAETLPPFSVKKLFFLHFRGFLDNSFMWVISGDVRFESRRTVIMVRIKLGVHYAHKDSPSPEIKAYECV